MTVFRKAALWLLAGLVVGFAGCSAPGTHLAYATLPGENAVAAYRINNQSAGFTRIVGSPYPAGHSPSAVVVDNAREFAYVTNQVDNTISRFMINSNIGSLQEIMPRIDTGFSPIALAMNSTGSLLFSLNEASNNITVYSVNSGALTEVSGSPFPTFPNAVAMCLTPSGNFLYVLNSNLAVVFGYTVSSSGRLQQFAGLPTPTSTGPSASSAGPLAMAMDPAGRFLYVANTLQNTAAILTINSSTGALTPITGSPFIAGTNPISITISPSGLYLYIANQGSDNITAYSIASNGQPTVITDSPFTTVGAPTLIVSDPNGNFIYVVNQSTKIITVQSVTTDTGVLAGSSASVSTSVAASSFFVTQ
jgi:6-phosphogluconolactonase